MGSKLICCKVNEYVPINPAHVATLIPNAYLLQSMGFLVLARPVIYILITSRPQMNADLLLFTVNRLASHQVGIWFDLNLFVGIGKK